MYLAMLKKIPLRDEVRDAFEILGRVDAEGFILSFEDADAEAVFEGAELFEGFSAFERANRERRIAEQEGAAVDVETDVFEVGFVDAAIVRDGAAGEVNGVTGEGGDDLDDVGVGDFAGDGDAALKGGHQEGGVVEEGLSGGVDSGGVNQGFVPLNVDDDVGGGVRGGFGDAVGAGEVVGTGHDDFGAEGEGGIEDALVVGGDEEAGEGFGLGGALEDVLEDGFVFEGDEGFAGEAAGGEAGRNDAKNSWGSAIERHNQG